MTKRKYLRRLRKALGNIPEWEKEELIEYYDELIEESFDRGKTEREVFSELDTPERAAENYLREGAPQGSFMRRAESKKHDVWGTVFLPLRIVLGIVLVVFGIVLFALTLAFCVAGVVLVLVGCYTFVMSFGLLFSGHAAIAFAQFGMAFALMGVGGLMGAFMPLMWRLNGALWVLVTGKPRRERPLKRGTLRSLATSGALLVLGALVFTAAYGALGFTAVNLVVLDDIEVHEFTLDDVDATELADFTLRADNLSLSIKRQESEEVSGIQLVYHDTKEQPRTLNYEDGVLSVTGPYQSWESVRIQWERGILFSAVGSIYHRAELYLPDEFTGNLAVELENGALSVADMVCADLLLSTKNGVISLQNVSAQNVSLESDNGVVQAENCTLQSLKADTDNGLVSLKNVTANGAITAQTDNGAITLNNVTAQSVELETANGAITMNDLAAAKVKANTNNGAVRFERLDASDIELEADNGAIQGSILGREADFAIDANTHSGSCNLRNKTDGTKRLKAKTHNGAIKILFKD